MSEDKRQEFYKSLTDTDIDNLAYNWDLWGRPEQLEPEGLYWFIWLVMAGRGFGKTRTGSEFIRKNVETGLYKRIGLIARTGADNRDIQVEGESGIMAVSSPEFMPKYEPSKRRVIWPNGAMATTYSAEEPDLLRGPQHDLIWADEAASWKYPETWDMAMFGLRLGHRPKAIVTTTPRPRRIIRELLNSKTTVVTKGSTYDNVSNLPPSFFEKIIAKYEGTRLGKQEIYAELLEDTPGALWTRAIIDNSRVRNIPDLVRIITAIDPATTSGDASDKTGIVTAGKAIDGHFYVLSDDTLKDTPKQWAQKAINIYKDLKADLIVGETNNGGDLIETVLRTIDINIPYKKIHASRGKITRAEPISSLYEQGKVHHVGKFDDMEDEMCTYTAETSESPNRMDALVWAITELMDDAYGEILIAKAW